MTDLTDLNAGQISEPVQGPIITPQVGDNVIYYPTADERKHMRQNLCNDQNHLPAVVVATFGKYANLSVFVDGPLGDLWVTSRELGVDPGQFSYGRITL